MVTLEEFVKEIKLTADKSGLFVEPEQSFPDYDLLFKVCQVLMYASTMREEGRYSTFRVCFIDSDSKFLEPYIYSHVVHFDAPMPFGTKDIHRLAPALNANNSYLILKAEGDKIIITGLIAGYTTWERISSREIDNGVRMPQIANLLVNGPGEIKACLGEEPLISMQWGNLIHYRTEKFSSTYVAQVIKEGSNIPEKYMMMFLSRIFHNLLELAHGAHIYIVPDEGKARDNTRIKYQLPVNFMFQGDDKDTVNKQMDKELLSYADMVSKFTSVDGAVVLSSNFDLIGFGAETLVDSSSNEEPDMCFISYDGTVDVTKRYNDNGMRHRACYQFCNSIEGAVALIVSHDGFIKVCTKRDGKVVVYDNISPYVS